MKIQLHEYKNENWGYRFIGDNGENMCKSSEGDGYSTKSNAKRALLKFIKEMENIILINENKKIPLDIEIIPYKNLE